MPRAGLSTSAVVDAALTVIDERGPDGLTLAAVAAHTGVATPSLYKHVGNLAELRAMVGVRVLEDVTARLTAAAVGRSGDDAVGALMRAFRAYALEHPSRYTTLSPDPMGEPALATAGTALLDVFLGVLRAYELDGAAAVHATRCLRSMAHGFVSIEISGGFGLPEEVDESYERLIAMFVASLPRRVTPARS